MRDLRWNKDGTRWWSGHYSIESITPSTWVLSRNRKQYGRRDMRPAIIEGTARSAGPLKEKAAVLARKRSRRRKAVISGAFLLVSLVAIALSAAAAAEWSAVILILASVVAIPSLVSVVGNLTGRPWESIRQHHQ